MKRLLIPLVLFISGLALALANPPASPENSVEDPFRPGSQHAELQKLTGTWDAVVISRDPKGAEMRTKGTLTTTKHTEFHTVDSFRGEFMGMELIGQGINGYCPIEKQYFTFWTDSMTPTPMRLSGNHDAAKGEWTMTGECFGMSGKLEPCRTVTRQPDDAHRTWTLFGNGPDGKETQLLQIEYTRRK